MLTRVITNGGPNRRGRPCKCAGCGTIRKCTPLSDFYVLTGDSPDGLLWCTDCAVTENNRRRAKQENNDG